MTIDPKYTVIVGTSGSTDYLRDTSSQRFWPVSRDVGPICDGLHDEDAPTQYLCSQCYLRGDHSAFDDDEHEHERID